MSHHGDNNRSAQARKNERTAILVFGSFVMLLLIVLGVLSTWRVISNQPNVPQGNDLEQDKAAIATVERVVASEELILSLTPRLRDLSRSVQNLQLPDLYSRDLFADSVSAVDLAARDASGVTEQLRGVSVRTGSWRIDSQQRQRSRAQLSFWRALLDEVRFFEHAKFYFIRGEFTDETYDKFSADVGFSGLARLSSGVWAGIEATLKVRWRRVAPSSSSDETTWRISHWDTTRFQTIESDRLLFAETLEHALPDDRDLRRARISRHREILIRNYFGQQPAKLPAGYHDSRFFPDSNALHPGLSVVDIDNDGFDDLYLSVRWGRNQLLRNRGDGTFEEVAAEFGLDIEGRSTAAIFADFDNDGDADLMLGRSLEQSMYLVNEGGRFHDRSKSLVLAPLPYLVSSVSASDYNGDGLMDVYFCTYTPTDLNERIAGDRAQSSQQAHQYLTKEQVQHLEQISSQDHHPLLAQVGPPNVLLVNLGGGKFDVAPQHDQWAVWKNTFQATWADYDDDGDPDLYVANDYAADQLFRNDGDAGFVDVTAAVGVDQMGFAMGASWGDYDNDGRQDLYVSNMYSKAGMRVLAKFADVDDRFARMVEGNYLYRSGENGFQLVSGLKRPALTVARAGWSWGGQFADLNNDGFLDVYVPNGYYTVPDPYSTDVDL